MGAEIKKKKTNSMVLQIWNPNQAKIEIENKREKIIEIRRPTESQES